MTFVFVFMGAVRVWMDFISGSLRSVITSDNCFHYYDEITKFHSFRIDRNQKNLFMAKDYSLYIINCN